MIFLNAAHAKRKRGTLYALRKTFVLAALIFFYSCAQILMPNGGAKDTTPPRVVKYMPDSAAVNFNAKEINLVFNEYIQLKDVNNQLIVSPLMEEAPEVKLVKNRIVNISFKKPLLPNTTYTLNFGSAIADYNEGNVLEGFQYIFSTGTFIDSLSLAGKADYAFDHKTDKGILVMLYEDQSDSAPYKLLPSYFSKTKPDGSFKINNMHPGKYTIFALKDLNRNYKYDEGEDIAFADGPVKAGSKIPVELHLFKEIPKELKVVSVKAPEYGHVFINFNKPAGNISMKPLGSIKFPTEILEFSKNKDTLDYWFSGPDPDSLKLELRADDKPFDTLEVKLMTKEIMKKTSKGDKSGLTATTNAVNGQRFDLDKGVRLVFNHPLQENASLDSLIKFAEPFRKDSAFPNGARAVLAGTYQFYDKRKINLYHNCTIKDLPGSLAVAWEPNKNYKTIIPPGTLTDIFGSKNDTIVLNFKTQEEKYYGTLKVKMSLPAGKNFILQFLDGKENVLKEEQLSASKTLDYAYLPPGSYRFKLIYDANSNGKWDTGNYLKKQQAEQVIYYDQPITIRSNWDLEIEWKVKE